MKKRTLSMILMIVFLVALFPQLVPHAAAADKVSLNTNSTTFMSLGDTMYTPDTYFPYLVSFELYGPSGELVESQSYRTSGSYWYSMGGLSPGYNGTDHYLFTARTTGVHTLRITTGTLAVTLYDQRNGIVYWEVRETNTKAYSVVISDPCGGNHTWGEWTQIKAPTCTESGQRVHTCTRCNTTEYETIPAEHNWSEWTQTTAPTCTTTGMKTHYCTLCNVNETVEIDALGHKWSDWKVTKAATVTAEGAKERTCSNCGETEIEVIPKQTPTNPFLDVKQGEYYYDPVLWAVNHQPQITNGTSATTFSPEATCTRGQVVTFLWRAKGCPQPKSSANPFNDVALGAYYYEAVLWANENGITNGTSANSFSPDQPCTRAQVVTFLWRTEGKPAAGGSGNPFTDVPAGQYYTTAVLWAVNHKPEAITNGTSANTFSPDATCTRGQIVTFLYRDMK